MLKKIMSYLFLFIFTLVLASCDACKRVDKELLDRIDALEKKVVALEKAAKAPAKPGAPAEQQQAYNIPIGESYVLGNPKAPLTITKFSDYQCPFCQRAHESFIEKVVEDPELKDKVKVVFKHFPLSFHKQARPASKFALAAGEQGHDCFWKMTSKLYKNQRGLTDDNFKKWAEEITCKKNDGKVAKLDSKKVWDDYKKNDAKYEAMIKDDMSIGMKSGVRGTPSFYLNGWKLSQRSVDSVKAMIKEKNL